MIATRLMFGEGDIHELFTLNLEVPTLAMDNCSLCADGLIRRLSACS